MASYTGNASTCVPSGGNSPGQSGYYCGNYYQGEVEIPGMFSHAPKSIAIRAVPDGTSSTLFVGEKTVAKPAAGCSVEGTNYACWMGQFGMVSSVNYGINLPCRSSWTSGNGFGSMHEGGAHFTMVDGAVRFISENVNLTVLTNLSTRMGNETIGEY